MAQNTQESWRVRYRPYIVAATLAFVLTLLIAPEVNEGHGMEPTIKDGQVLIITKTSYSVKRGVPDAGQVVILEKNVAPDVSQDNIIARVVGLPGDTIEIKDGQVMRNGKAFKTKSGIAGAAGNMKLTVGKDDVFLLCDNRKEIVDSRNKKLGPVNMKEIKGNVKFTVWPLSKIGGIS